MLVRQGYDALRKLMKEGHGNLPMIAVHGGSGVSYEVDIYGHIMAKADHDDAGVLCDWENGDKYVSISID